MDVVQLSDVCAALDYDSSAYYREHLHQFAPNISHIFRTTAPLGVKGIYVLKTNPGNGNGKVHSIELPAVFLAETHSQDQAQSEAEVREMHKKLWNLGSAPFFIAVLPHQIRIYTGFTYAEDEENHGLIGHPIPVSHIKSREHLRDILADFSAQAIDSGRIWQKHKRELDLQQRVDTTLLKNLRILEDTLRQKGLSPTMSHALIGKYVYLRYLWDREILTPSHLHDLDVTEQDIFAHSAHRDGLDRLIAALETWFNGRIFPIDFDRADAPTDEHIGLVASTFRGDVFDPAHPELVQLHLNFKAYDFRYIPVETFSAVYEQFIPDPKASGAVYTPEFLADYLPSVVIEGPALNQPGDPIEIELPAIVVEAETDDARMEKRLPDRWEILSEEAKKEALAREHLTALETKVLNRWILWWGVRPEDYLLQREERERIQRQMDYNNDLLRTLEKVRPGVLDGEAD